MSFSLPQFQKTKNNLRIRIKIISFFSIIAPFGNAICCFENAFTTKSAY